MIATLKAVEEINKRGFSTLNEHLTVAMRMWVINKPFNDLSFCRVSVERLVKLVRPEAKVPRDRRESRGHLVPMEPLDQL